MSSNQICLMLILTVLISGAGCRISFSPTIVKYSDDGRRAPALGEKGKSSQFTKFRGKNTHSISNFVDVNGKMLAYVNGGQNIFTNDYALPSGDPSQSWKIRKLFPESEMSPAIQDIFVKDGTIWVVADRWVLKSRDGNGWKKMAGLTPFELAEIDFTDEKTGYISSREGEYGCRILKTTDGGINWKTVYKSPMAGNPFDLLVIDENKVLIAVGDKYLLQTDDGGRNWTPRGLEIKKMVIRKDGFVELNDYGAAQLALAADDKIWVVGRKGSIYYSDDRAVSWKKPENLPEGIKDQTLQSVAFSPKGKGIVTGQGKFIVTTKDFGQSWTEIPLESPYYGTEHEQLGEVKFIGERGFIVGRESFYEVSFDRPDD